MKFNFGWIAAFVFGIGLIAPPSGSAQAVTEAGSTTPSNFTADYSQEQVGVLIRGSSWMLISAVLPSKTRVKNALAASFTYGAVRGVILADYNGAHAEVQLNPARPTICLCHLISLPGEPLLVKLYPQKGMREFDGGKLPILGAKLAEAGKNDSIQIEISHPENTVWLIRPLETLPAGEYAVMLGAQNVSIFPFTVAASSDSPAVK